MNIKIIAGGGLLRGKVFNKIVLLSVTAALVVGGFFVFNTGTAFAATATVASQVDYYTVNNGTNFIRSLAPATQNLSTSGGTVSQTINNSDGSVTIHASSATGYADSGFYTRSMKIEDFKSILITGSGPYGLNIWLDTNTGNDDVDTNGNFFTWINESHTTFDNYYEDKSMLGPSSNDALTINDLSQFDGSIDSGPYGSHTLAELKLAYPDTNIAFWVGTTIMSGGDRNATILTFEVVPPPVLNTDKGIRYSTIQAAINDATSGDTINVAAGDYTEQIQVTKQLTINGSNAGISAGVNADTRGAESIVNGGFYISTAADGTVIDGFTVQGGYVVYGSYNNGFTVEPSGTPGITIQNNIIKNISPANSNGIETVGGTNKLTIKDNNISNNYRGIYLNPGSDNQIVGNIIDANNGSGVGIGSDGQSNLTINGNTISHQTEGWGSSAVGTNVVAHNNSFIGNTVSVAWYAGTSNKIDATPNWWGSAVLADVAAKISSNSNVFFKPYYITSTTGEFGTLSNITTITAFSIPTQIGSATINQSAQTITINMPYGTVATSLVPTFTTTTTGASVKIDGVTQTSGVTAKNFTSPVTYTVTSVDGATTQTYTVTVTVLPADTYTITFDSAGGSVVAPIVQNYGTAVTAPSNPTKTGYTFSAWSPVVPATMPALSQTLTAQWTANQGGGNGGGGGGRATPAVPANVTIPDGCAPGDKFSTTTGRNCNAATPAVPAGQVLGASTQAGQVLGAASFNFTLLLKNNSKGNEVIELQKFLNALGYTLTADGKFGAKTKGAVIKFQIANKLKGDGVVGALTRAFLNK